MSKRREKEDRLQPDPQVDKKLRRLELRCSVCPPNKGENSKRHAKHGPRPPKSKQRPHGISPGMAGGWF
jgi:hypothetical protein